jgi:hypothetical protein
LEIHNEKIGSKGYLALICFVGWVQWINWSWDEMGFKISERLFPVIFASYFIGGGLFIGSLVWIFLPYQ